jgi:hypothetical protein
LPADNVPPIWIQTKPCDVQVEQDSADSPEKFQKVGLAAFAQDPDDLSKAGLRFQGSPNLKNEVTATVSENGEFIAKASGAEEGPGGTVEVTLTDVAGGKADSSVTCTIRVVESTEPPVRVKTVTLETTQGQPLTVEIASLLEIPGKGTTFDGSPSVQSGEGSVQASGTTLTYTSGKEFAGNANIAFTVKEKRTSNGVPRPATGNIAVLVKGRPTGLTAPKAEGGTLSDAKIVLTYGAANPNYDPSPVTYSVKSTSGGVAKDCGTSLTCTVDAGDGVKNAIDYAFVVTAKNATDISEPSPASNVVQTDVKPSPPTDLKLTEEGDTTLSFAFNKPKDASNGMSPITGYDCILNGQATRVGPSPQICSFSGLANGTDYTLAVKTITAKSESELSGTAKGNPYGAPKVTAPILKWESADNGMTLTASADVKNNGRTVTATWTISCSGESVPTNPAKFTCPRTAGTITATITAINELGPTEADRGPTVATANYAFPAEPTAAISLVSSGLNSVKVVAVAQGTGTNLRLQYSLDQSKWDTGAALPATADAKTDVYVRACSDEWPECGAVASADGIAYDKAPTPICSPEGPGPEAAETFTCTLSAVNASKNFTLLYPQNLVTNGKVDGTALTVTCGQTAIVAIVHAQYEGYADSKSDPLKVLGPICPPTPTDPAVPN